MTETGWLLLGLNALVAFVLGALGYAVAKILFAARSLANRKPEGAETAFMAAAMEEAVQRLRAQELAMQERAEASEHLSEEIIASMSSGLLVVSEDRHVRTLNPAGRVMLGLSDDSPSSAMDDVLQTAAPLAAAIDECLETKRPVLRRTLQTQLRGGATVHLGVTVSPLRGPQGHEQGAICLFTDLSDVVDLEEQLRLKDSLARLGELTAGIAHEFRNGLATIHGYSRLLDPEKLPADYLPYVQGLRNETDALRQVVTNFLNFAKPTELTLGGVALQRVIERAADDVRSDVAAGGGAVDIRGEFGTVLGDDVVLRQAFSNLCRNALEACADAGIAPRIVVEGSIDEAQGTQQVIVADNGPGIDPNIITRMFRPFFTTKSKGTGLGLAIVQRIIVIHNGRVSVANGEQGGARFTVSLPLHAASTVAAL
jgi:signal transduction histidine kinase